MTGEAAFVPVAALACDHEVERHGEQIAGFQLAEICDIEWKDKSRNSEIPTQARKLPSKLTEASLNAFFAREIEIDGLKRRIGDYFILKISSRSLERLGAKRRDLKIPNERVRFVGSGLKMRKRGILVGDVIKRVGEIATIDGFVSGETLYALTVESQNGENVRIVKVGYYVLEDNN